MLRLGLLLTAAALVTLTLSVLLSGGSGGSTALATLPTPTPVEGLDFSLAGDLARGVGDTCDSSGTPTNVCQVPLNSTFTVNLLLNSFPAGMPGGGYAAYWAEMSYTGVTSDQMASSIDPFGWPDCAVDSRFPGATSVGVACSMTAGGTPSTYLGRLASVEFTCAADGSVTLVHTTDGQGYADSFLEDSNGDRYAESYQEALDIQCVAPQAYPGDRDGDGCPDTSEEGVNQMMGGLRNFLNQWDYANPSHDGENRVDDILIVVQHFGLNAGDPGYSTDYDRTYVGPNAWNAGPPDGKVRVADILAIVAQFGHDCS